MLVAFEQEPLPDLVPGIVTTPPFSARPGQQLIIEYIDQNTGTATSGTHTNTLYISTESFLDGSAQYVAEASIADIIASSNTLEDFVVTVPADINPGVYYYLIQSDTYGEVTERDENNNVLALQLNVQADFTLTNAGDFSTSVSSTTALAVRDYDGDGDDDIAEGITGGSNKVFNNTGSSLNDSTDIDMQSITANTSGLAWGDVNNDHQPDLYIANDGQNFIYYYDGSDMVRITGIGLDTETDPSTSAAWVDYDQDGDLDIYVTNSGTTNNTMYQNNITSFAVVDLSITNDGANSSSSAWADVDNDGDMDLFLVNNGPNALYINDGGTFTLSTSAGVDQTSANSTGASWGDIDNDGDPDLYVTNTDATVNELYLNDGNGNFTALTGTDLTNAAQDTESAVMLDYNNDGFLDIYESNAGTTNNNLFRNNLVTAILSFSRVSTGDQSNDGSDGGGAVATDLNDDGQLDLLVGAFAQNNRVFINNGNFANNWLKINLNATLSNTQAIGARVEILADGRRLYRDVLPLSGGKAQSSAQVHFGMSFSTLADEIIVRWPSGEVSLITNQFTNQTITITEPGESPIYEGDVLIIGDGGTETQIDSILINAGFTTTIVDDASYDGTNPDLFFYEAVILTHGVDALSDMPASGQQAIVDYVNEGGGFISTALMAKAISEGRYATLSPLISRDYSFDALSSEDMTLQDPGHPIFEGVTNFNVQHYFGAGFATNGGNPIMTGNNSGDALVINTYGKGKTVNLSTAGSASAQVPFTNANMRLLLLNSLSWVMDQNFVDYVVDPTDISTTLDNGGATDSREIVLDNQGTAEGEFNLDNLWNGNTMMIMSAGQSLSIPAAAWTGTSGVTAEMWLSTFGTVTGEQILMNHLSGAGGWRIALQGDTYPQVVEVIIEDNTGAQTTFSTGNLIAENGWYHIGLVIDLDLNTLRIYVNGRTQVLADISGIPYTDGSGSTGISDDISSGFEGAIDEIRIWNAPLDSATLNGFLFSRLGGAETNLAGYWHFDSDVTTTTVPNVVPVAGLDASITGSPVLTQSDRAINPDWLSFSQTSGNTPGQASTTVIVDFEPVGLPAGTYGYSNTLFTTSGDYVINIEMVVNEFGSSAIPTNLSAFVLAEDVAQLDWEDNADDETGYIVQRSLNPSDNFSTLASTAADATTYNDSTIASNTTYYYRVRSTNDIATSQPGNVVELIVKGDPIAVATPEPFTIDSTITITFDASNAYPDGALDTASKVYYYSSIVTSNVGNPAWDGDFTVGNWGVDDGLGEMTQVSGTIWEFTLTPRDYYNIPDSITAYYLAMVFSNADGNAAGRGPAGADGTGNIYLPIAPYNVFAPTDLTASSTSGSIFLSWTDNNDVEDGYIVQRSVGDNTAFSTLATLGTDAVGYTDSDVTVGTTYFYRVQAFNSLRSSAFSAEASSEVLNYCSSAPINAGDTRIDRVQFADLDVSSDGGTCQQYTDFTSEIATVFRGQSPELIITTGSCGNTFNHHFRAWIDWGNDGSFDAGDEVFASSSPVSNGTYSAPVSIATDLVEGSSYTLRISVWQSDAGTNPVTPCDDAAYEFGETEDYTLSVGISPDYALRDFNITPNPAVTGVDDLTITAAVDNNGGSANTDLLYSIYLSADATLDGSDQVIYANENLGILGAGNTIQINNQRSIPTSVDPQTAFLIMEVFDESNLTENNTADNTAAVEVTFTDPQPDITFSALSINPTSVALEANTQLDFTLENNGGDLGGADVNLNVRLSSDQVPDGSDIVLANINLGTIGRYASLAVSETLTIPSTADLGNQFILITLDPSDDIAETDESNNTGATGIEVFEIVDDTAPVIRFVGRPTTFFPGSASTLDITANISDDTEVAGIEFYYRGITSSNLQGPITPTATATADEYSVSIASSSVDEIGIEYYFVASDAAGNTAYSDPNSNTGATAATFASTLRGYVDNSLSFSGIRTGTTEADYQLIAFPLAGSPSVGSLLEELGTADASQWRMFSYNGNSNSELGTNSTVRAGSGYWLISATVNNLSFGGGSAVTASADNPYTISLRSGWNLIGNPYNFNIDWTSVLAHNVTEGIISAGDVGSIRLFNAGSGFTADGASSVLARFRGAFVFSNVSASLQIPLSARTSASGRTGTFGQKPILTEDIDSEEWLLSFALQAGGRSTQFNAIGMHPSASAEMDRYDDLSLPWPGRRHELYSLHSGLPFEKFSRDVVPSQSGYTWEFTARSEMPEEYLSLVWEQEAISNARRGLFLYDVTADVLIDMRKTDRYTFANGGEHRFQMIYGDPENLDSNLLPRLMGLKNVFPNPGTGTLHVHYSLPQGADSYHVRLYITDLSGRQLMSSESTAQPAGFYEVQWSGQDLQGKSIPEGMYLLHLQVDKEQNSQHFIQKLIRR